MDTSKRENQLSNQEAAQSGEAGVGIAQAPQDLEPIMHSFAGHTALEGVEESAEMSNVKESVRRQLETHTSKGYKVITAQLSSMSIDSRFSDEVAKPEIATPKEMSVEFEEWFTDKKAFYVAEAMGEDPDLNFTLIAPPNTLVNKDGILEMARKFGEDQPKPVYVAHKEAYGRYSAEELSGANPDNGKKINFRLIPNKNTPGMRGGVIDQRYRLEVMRADNPFLGVQSVLDDLVLLQTLRASGDRLQSQSHYDLASHFDLPEYSAGSWWGAVPKTHIWDDGEVGLVVRAAMYDDGWARVSIG
jgi:hypothetical protein